MPILEREAPADTDSVAKRVRSLLGYANPYAELASRVLVPKDRNDPTRSGLDSATDAVRGLTQKALYAAPGAQSLSDAVDVAKPALRAPVEAGNAALRKIMGDAPKIQESEPLAARSDSPPPFARSNAGDREAAEAAEYQQRAAQRYIPPVQEEESPEFALTATPVIAASAPARTPDDELEALGIRGPAVGGVAAGVVDDLGEGSLASARKPAPEIPDEPAKARFEDKPWFVKDGEGNILREGMLTAEQQERAAAFKEENQPRELTPKERMDMQRKTLAGAGISMEQKAASDREQRQLRELPELRRQQSAAWGENLRTYQTSTDPMERFRAAQQLEDLAQQSGNPQAIEAATKNVKRMQNDPYFVRDYNRAAAQANMEAQRAAAEAELSVRQAEADGKLGLEREKLQLERDKIAAAERSDEKKFAAAERSDEKKFGVEERRRKEDKEFQAQQSALADDRARDLKKQTIDAVFQHENNKEAAMDVERLHNAPRDAGAKAVQDGIARLKEELGIKGKLKSFFNGEEVNAELDKILDAAQRHVSDTQQRIISKGRTLGYKPETIQMMMESAPNFNRERVKRSILEKGPKKWDDIAASFEDMRGAITVGGDIATDIFAPEIKAPLRALGGALGGARGVQNFNMAAPMPAPADPNMFGLFNH